MSLPEELVARGPVIVAAPPEPRGGVARSARRLVASLRGAGVDARLAIAFDALFPGDLRVSSDAMRFGLVDPWDLQAWTSALVRVVRGARAVVGFYGTSAGFCAVAAASQEGVPSILALRGNDVDRDFFLPEKRGFLEWAVRRATRVTTVSREMSRKVEGWFGVRATSILNGVSKETFRPDPEGARAFREKHGLEGPLLGVFGEVKPKRGIERLAHAPGFQLVVVGRVREVELPEGARLIPWTDDPSELRAAYSACAVVAQPSLHDGCPNVVLEAMACGRVVVASPVGALPELVQPDVTGFLCSSDEEWRATLARLSKDPRPELGEAARARVPTLEAERDAWLALLGEVRG